MLFEKESLSRVDNESRMKNLLRSISMGKLNVHQSISINNETIREGKWKLWWKILNCDCTFFNFVSIVCFENPSCGLPGSTHRHAIITINRINHSLLSYRKAQRFIDSKLYTSSLCGRISEEKSKQKKKNLLCERCFVFHRRGEKNRRKIQENPFPVSFLK